MKNQSMLVAALMLMLAPFAVAQAEEAAETEPVLIDEAVPTLYEEVMEDGEEVVTMDPDEVVGTDEDGDLTSEEYEELVEEADELTEEALEDLESVQGDVVAVNDDGTVVIETSDGDLLTISTEVYTAATRARGGGKLLNPKPGDSVIVTAADVELAEGSVEVQEDATTGVKNVLIFIVTDEGKTQVSAPSVPVYRNGERTTLATLTEADDVHVAQNADGEVVAIYASSSDSEVVESMETNEADDDTGMPLWYWLAGLVVIVGLLFMAFRTKEESTRE